MANLLAKFRIDYSDVIVIPDVTKKAGEAIQLTKYTNLKKNILSYLKKCAKNERVVNLPCYINAKIVKNAKNLTKKYLKPFINRHSALKLEKSAISKVQ